MFLLLLFLFKIFELISDAASWKLARNTIAVHQIGLFMFKYFLYNNLCGDLFIFYHLHQLILISKFITAICCSSLCTLACVSLMCPVRDDLSDWGPHGVTRRGHRPSPRPAPPVTGSERVMGSERRKYHYQVFDTLQAVGWSRVDSGHSMQG